ncbi:MAG: glycine/betaine/sarcosine/D-proline family reductase selenoprotein B [Chloroflexi bacterium]|nr:glycine/betaine/sarcosine/D-proline family reductase selenoprotein B [Chloroflexota bacterium]
MRTYRVVHYLNQFFAQLGGEDQADLPPRVVPGPVGPGRLLARELGGAAEVVATVVCGDNYFAEDLERGLREVLPLIAAQRPDAVAAGPAFDAGRYGLACGAVAAGAQEQLGLPSVAGMYPGQAAAPTYRARVYVVATASSTRDMGPALARMAKLLLKQVQGTPLGSPEEEGYLPRGLRKNQVHALPAATRMVDMLLAKVAGRPFQTEVPMPEVVPVAPAPPIADLSRVAIALVTSGGIVPRGNPDGLRSHASDRYGRYSLRGLERLPGGAFEAHHAGYYHKFVNQDPNRMVPLDALRELARQGRIGGVGEHLYTLAGSATAPAMARVLGQRMAADLEAEGVAGAILTST